MYDASNEMRHRGGGSIFAKANAPPPYGVKIPKVFEGS